MGFLTGFVNDAFDAVETVGKRVEDCFLDAIAGIS